MISSVDHSEDLRAISYSLMRSFLLAMISLSIVAPLAGQQLSLRYSRGSGSFVTYSNWKGYSVGWSHILKSGNQIGVSFSHDLNSTPYSWIHTAFNYETGVEKTYFEDREPQNQILKAELFAGFRALKRNHCTIHLGPAVSLNWLLIHEKVHRYANEWFIDAEYYNQYSKKRRLGLGLFIEIGSGRLFTDRLSAFMRMQSTITGYDGIGSWDLSEPATILLQGSSIGLKWNFGPAGVPAGD